MSCHKRLNKSFKNAPVLPMGSGYSYVLFSDCHRGNGTHNDNFLRNEHLYLAALRHYYERGFTYIELGDGDELWENRSIEPIKEIHNDVFALLIFVPHTNVRSRSSPTLHFIPVLSFGMSPPGRACI